MVLDPGEVDIDRAVLKMCRHELTTYDDDQSVNAHQAACGAIKAKYPWLAAECDAQLRRRAILEAEPASMLALWEAEQAAREEARRQRSAASVEANSGPGLGMVVDVRIKGHERSATITRLGRCRVEVSYTIKTGAERQASLYASEVRRSLVASPR